MWCVRLVRRLYFEPVILCATYHFTIFRIKRIAHASYIRHTGETLLITHHLQLEPIPPFGANFSKSFVYGQPQQHCGSTTWWVMVCMRVVSRSVSVHLVPAVPDPRIDCLRRFLELPDGGLSDAWCNADCIQELHSRQSNKAAAANLYWINMALPAIVLNLVLQVDLQDKAYCSRFLYIIHRGIM